MQLTIQHKTRYSYDPAVAAAALRLKLFPPEAASQHVLDWQVTVNGKDVSPILTEAPGDRVALWHRHGPVDAIELVVSGTVSTTDTAGILRDLPQGARPAIFLRNTALTRPDDAIRDLANEADGDDLLARMHDLSRLTGEAITYRSGATDATTAAGEAMTLGAGVCQDQAHVFISAARTLGVPARYVAGYLFDPDPKDALDETHAWAEAHIDGLGWVGFDITNELCPTDAYVRLSCGLDAAEAAPVRGTVTGDTEEALETEVKVSQASTQSQQ